MLLYLNKISQMEELNGFLAYLSHEIGAAPSTQRSYRSALVRFVQWYESLGRSGFRGVGVCDLERYLRLLHRTLKHSSLRLHLAAIRSYMHWLVLEENLPSSPATLIQVKPDPPSLPRPLNRAQEDILLVSPNRFRGDRYWRRDRSILSVLASSGLRASELCGLLIDNVDLERRMLLAVGKGMKERIVPFTVESSTLMGEYIESERVEILRRTASTSPLMFLSRSGRRISRSGLWRLVTRYARRTGLDWCGPHTLRHTCATDLLLGGMDLRVIQEILGHASILTTQRYTTLDYRRIKEVHTQFHPRA